MAPNPSESALMASLQAKLLHWKTFSTVANTQLEQALHDWFAKDAIATASLRKMHSECSIFSYNRRVYIITV